MSQREVLAQDAELAAIFVGASALVPQGKFTEPVRASSQKSAYRCSSATQQAYANALSSSLSRFKSAAAGQHLLDDGRSRRMDRCYGRTSKPSPRAFRRCRMTAVDLRNQSITSAGGANAGFHESMRDFSREQDAVAIESAIAVRLIGKRRSRLSTRGSEKSWPRTDALAPSPSSRIQLMAQPCDRKGDAVVVVGMFNESVVVEINEGAPVESYAQLSRRQRLERLLPGGRHDRAPRAPRDSSRCPSCRWDRRRSVWRRTKVRDTLTRDDADRRPAATRSRSESTRARSCRAGICPSR